MRILPAAALLLALTQPAAAICPTADANGDNRMSIDEVIAVIGHALNGCPIRAERFEHQWDHVRDHATGLFWERHTCTLEMTLRPQDQGTLADAYERAARYNFHRRAGRTDWRVPSVWEARNIAGGRDGFEAGFRSDCPCYADACNAAWSDPYFTWTSGRDGNSPVGFFYSAMGYSSDPVPADAIGVIRLVAGP